MRKRHRASLSKVFSGSTDSILGKKTSLSTPQEEKSSVLASFVSLEGNDDCLSHSRRLSKSKSQTDLENTKITTNSFDHLKPEEIKSLTPVDRKSRRTLQRKISKRQTEEKKTERLLKTLLGDDFKYNG
eukprot:Pgem_evm1s2363